MFWYDNYKWIKTVNGAPIKWKGNMQVYRYISLKRFPIPKRNLTLAGNAACNFRFETTMRYGKTCKFEDSNIKETSCSRVIAWSVNDLSSLLRPEKKKEKEKEKEGKEEKGSGDRATRTARQLSVKMATLGSIYALKVGHFAVAHCQCSHMWTVSRPLQFKTGNL